MTDLDQAYAFVGKIRKNRELSNLIGATSPNVSALAFALLLKGIVDHIEKSDKTSAVEIVAFAVEALTKGNQTQH